MNKTEAPRSALGDDPHFPDDIRRIANALERIGDLLDAILDHMPTRDDDGHLIVHDRGYDG